MANIITRPDWHIPDSEVTSEHVYRNRRKQARSRALHDLRRWTNL